LSKSDDDTNNNNNEFNTTKNLKKNKKGHVLRNLVRIAMLTINLLHVLRIIT